VCRRSYRPTKGGIEVLWWVDLGEQIKNLGNMVENHWEQLGGTHWERGGNTKILPKASSLPPLSLSQKENLQSIGTGFR
jgi:hypothetical protein